MLLCRVVRSRLPVRFPPRSSWALAGVLQGRHSKQLHRENHARYKQIGDPSSLCGCQLVEHSQQPRGSELSRSNQGGCSLPRRRCQRGTGRGNSGVGFCSGLRGAAVPLGRINACRHRQVLPDFRNRPERARHRSFRLRGSRGQERCGTDSWPR